MGQAAQAAPTILIVEDERRIADLLRVNLAREGFTPEVAYGGQDAMVRFPTCQPALVILDLMLPQVDGFAVAEAIRTQSDVPILMLTAKGAEEDKLRGFELGADDYLTKPFSMKELLARVRALLRRHPPRPSVPEQQEGVLRVGALEVDPRSRAVRKAGVPVELSLREFDLLLYLMSRPGQLLSRERLLAEVWGYEYFGDSARTVDVTVWRLRNKIEENPRDPAYILSRRGVGYFFRAEE
jgi:two-component system response regulator VicR